jgi:hypothetical protein
LLEICHEHISFNMYYIIHIFLQQNRERYFLKLEIITHMGIFCKGKADRVELWGDLYYYLKLN